MNTPPPSPTTPPASTHPFPTPAVEPPPGRWDWLRECPATWFLMLVWVTLFGWGLARSGGEWSIRRLLVGEAVRLSVLKDMGASIPSRVVSGQFQRVVTANHLHLNVLHLGLNLLGLYFLGRIVEEWYGAGQFLGAALLIGTGGNAVSAVVRVVLGRGELISVGGSTLVFGLIGLCAVVGMRTHTRYGQHLRQQMFLLLFINGVIGFLVPGVDNLNHAAGAAMGGLVGLADLWMFHRAGRTINRGIALVAALAVAASFGVQVQAARAEATRAELLRTLAQLQLSALQNRIQWDALRRNHQMLAAPDLGLNSLTEFQLYFIKRSTGLPRTLRFVGLTPRVRRALRDALRSALESDRIPWDGPDPEARRRLRELIARALFKNPTPEELVEVGELIQKIDRADQAQLEKRLAHLLGTDQVRVVERIEPRQRPAQGARPPDALTKP